MYQRKSPAEINTESPEIISTRIKINEENFKQAFEEDKIKGVFTVESKELFSRIINALGEIYITYPTLLMINDRISDAISLLDQSENIMNYF